MMLSKKTEYNSLKTKVDNIDATNFVLKTKYKKDGSDFEDKISKIDKKNFLMLVTWLKKLVTSDLVLMLKLLK